MKKSIVISLIVLFFSCDQKVIKKPENLIPKDQMVEIFYDLAIINAAKKVNSRKLEDRDIETMDYLYARYNIDSLQFVESDLYYASIPSEYEALYKAVETRLEMEKSVFDLERNTKNDSIRRVLEDQRKNVGKNKPESETKDSLP